MIAKDLYTAIGREYQLYFRGEFSIAVSFSSAFNDSMFTADQLFDFPESLPFADYFRPDMAPWEWLPQIKKALSEWSDFSQPSELPSGLVVDENVFIDPSVKLPAFGVIQGPAYIGAHVELRPGIFIRGNVIVGAGSVLGNSCEFKNCLILDGAQVPHFNYVGDSILGNKAHLGAGVICSNLRLDQAEVRVDLPEGGKASTGLRKLGALIGDGAEVGCNAVLNPGSILGRKSLVMPTMAFRGYLRQNSIAFVREKIQVAPRMDL